MMIKMILKGCDTNKVFAKKYLAVGVLVQLTIYEKAKSSVIRPLITCRFSSLDRALFKYSYASETKRILAMFCKTGKTVYA